MRFQVPLLTILVFSTASVVNSHIEAQNPPKTPVKNAKRTFPKNLFQPRDMVKLAGRDIAGIADESVRHYVRYLDLHNIYPEERDDYIKVIDFALNSLSKRRAMNYVAVVPGSDKALVRLHLDLYDITPESWDTLGARGSGPIRSFKKIDQPDPYYHYVASRTTTPIVKKTKRVPWYSPEGRRYIDRNTGQPAFKEETTETRGTSETRVTLEHPPFVDPEDIVLLATATYTDYPIYRADWFIANALIAPAYYELLGLKTLEDYQKLVRFVRDPELQTKGVVVDSQEVSHNIRAALHTPTRAGYHFETFDYFTSTGEDNLLANLKARRRDAGELIATLPNSLQVYLLVNGEDKVVDFGDPNVVADRFTPWRNKLVWSGISCMICHDKGIKAVADEVRVLARPPVGLLVRDRKDFQEVIDQFTTPIEEPVQVAQLTYKRAVALATNGMETTLLANTLQKVFLRHVQTTMTVEDVSLELGCPPEKLIDLFSRVELPDSTLTQFAMRRPVRRDQWEDKGFAQAATLTYIHVPSTVVIPNAPVVVVPAQPPTNTIKLKEVEGTPFIHGGGVVPVPPSSLPTPKSPPKEEGTSSTPEIRSPPIKITSVDPPIKLSATIVIYCHPQATITLEGEKSQKISGTGPRRELNIPPIETSIQYSYVIQASWEEDNRNRSARKTVQISGGQITEIDLRDSP